MPLVRLSTSGSIRLIEITSIPTPQEMAVLEKQTSTDPNTNLSKCVAYRLLEDILKCSSFLRKQNLSSFANTLARNSAILHNDNKLLQHQYSIFMSGSVVLLLNDVNAAVISHPCC